MSSPAIYKDAVLLKCQLDQDGFFVLNDFLSRDEIKSALGECLDAIAKAEPVPNPEDRNFFEVYSLHACGGINLNRPALNALEQKPELLDIMRGILGEDCVSIGEIFQAYLTRAGHKQSWHTDSDSDDLPFQILTCLLYLQDQTMDLGYTRIVPGSHRRPITKRFPYHADLPRQVCHLIPAGTLCCFVSTVWHSATENQSAMPRIVFGVRFCRPEFAPGRMPAPHGRARHAKGYRRFGKPIFDQPNAVGSYLWSE